MAVRYPPAQNQKRLNRHTPSKAMFAITTATVSAINGLVPANTNPAIVCLCATDGSGVSFMDTFIIRRRIYQAYDSVANLKFVHLAPPLRQSGSPVSSLSDFPSLLKVYSS